MSVMVRSPLPRRISTRSWEGSGCVPQFHIHFPVVAFFVDLHTGVECAELGQRRKHQVIAYLVGERAGFELLHQNFQQADLLDGFPLDSVPIR